MANTNSQNVIKSLATKGVITNKTIYWNSKEDPIYAEKLTGPLNEGTTTDVCKTISIVIPDVIPEQSVVDALGLLPKFNVPGVICDLYVNDYPKITAELKASLKEKDYNVITGNYGIYAKA